MDVRLLKLLDNREEKYPHALEKQYRRVMNNIVRMWDTPDIQHYFTDLLVSSRSNRKGFPPEVAVEIAYLSMINIRQTHTLDPWASVPKAVRVHGESQGELYAPPAFFKACEKGQRDVIVMYISVGVGVNARDERLWTPLIICASHGNDKLAALLLKIGANIKHEDSAGFTALHWAAYNGFSKVVQLLLDKGAKINARSHKGFTPLQLAAGRGSLEVLALLLENRADINAVAEDGSTALHRATSNNHPAIVQFLLDKGADPEATLNTGEKPLDLALKSKRPTLIALLQPR
ncbi:MAG: ankyrin repeat domain-containing protein [Gallionella sp.]|nr:ankyrin repeat domain-containing protein [Gallionella sp.]MDD4958073.1 ankyrin repeat domain-containing protein [Gallionella sp.]